MIISNLHQSPSYNKQHQNEWIWAAYKRFKQKNPSNFAGFSYRNLSAIDRMYMTYEEWKADWKALQFELVFAPESGLDAFQIAPDTKEVLCNKGIPYEAGELVFSKLLEAPLQTVNQAWELEDPHYEEYLQVGHNQTGDPIALHLPTQQVVYLNQDQQWQEELINSSFLQLLPTAALVARFIKGMTPISDDSEFETEFSNEAYQKLRKDLMLIDPDMMLKGNSFWNCMLASMLWERDEERQQLG